MVILGLDPGTARLGWAIVETRNSKLETRNCGCIETSPKQTNGQRLLVINKEVTKLIKKYEPDALAIEELFFGANAKTAFMVGQARGVCILAAEQMKIPTYSYTPLQVKVAVTGYGSSEKYQVGQMVKTILRLPSVPKPDDTADALAVAITHAFSYKIKRLEASH